MAKRNIKNLQDEAKLKSNVFNSSIGKPFDFAYPNYTSEEEQELVAGFFEQLMIFDHVTLCTDRLNFTLYFLIKTIGINTVEQLIEAGYIRFMLWTPLLMTSSGTKREDDTIDESTVYGRPPIVAGSLTVEDMNPELNVERALAKFGLHRDRRRSFTRKAEKLYVIPEGMENSQVSNQLIIDAYRNNNLESLGLSFQKEPDQLNIQERGLLLKLGHKILETSILSNYGLKSFENYEPYVICKKNIENIGKAYNVADNSAAIFHLENLPKLKELFISERLPFDSVFKLRHGKTAKYYRNWINNIGESSNQQEVTRDYISQIKGDSKFFESNSGKLVKNLSMLAANAALGAAIAGPVAAVAGAGLGLLETFWIDSILKGKNPSMFIDNVRHESFPAYDEVYEEVVKTDYPESKTA